MPIEEVTVNAERALQQIADKIATARKILVVTGAGISTNCGIPDFRSKEGLYSLIENDYQKQKPRQASQSIKHIKGRDLFDVNIWKSAETTEVFLKFITGLRRTVATKEPSATHRFIKLLRDQRRLVRAYTQNIDGLEQQVGLKTDLADGRGSRSRFTKKSLALPTSASESLPGGALHGGCEAVQLHGDLDSLRCTVCQKLFNWEEGDRSEELPSGVAPECPACAEQDVIRRIAGRRGTRVGVLRPNVVLYGEEHQSADLIGPLVTSDIASGPDLLLIFGTSLKVHGLQKIVKEFSNAVHARKNGDERVIFINNTPPAGSTWKNVIDSWVNMDCDAFVRRIRRLRPDLWAKQVPLPYIMAHPSGKSGMIAKQMMDSLQDKENASKEIAVKAMAQTVRPLKKHRRTLGEINEATSNQGTSSKYLKSIPLTPTSTPIKKRKHSDFEVYEEGPIVVEQSSASWTLKAVEIPSSPPSIAIERATNKRTRTA